MHYFTDFAEFAKQCHTASRNAGWWKDAGLLPNDRTLNRVHAPVPDAYIIPTKLCLIHSEIDEAFEGYLTNAADEHLPHLPSIRVELADTLIRIGDLAGYMTRCREIEHNAVIIGMRLGETPEQYFNMMHSEISRAMEAYRKDRTKDFNIHMGKTVSLIYWFEQTYLRRDGPDVQSCIIEKMAYNAKRADHKPDARAAEGGKKF